MNQYYADWLVTSVILFTDVVFWNKLTIGTHVVAFLGIATYFYVLNRSKSIVQLATTPMILPVVVLLHYKLFCVAYQLINHDLVGFVGGLVTAVYLVNLPNLANTINLLRDLPIEVEEPKSDIFSIMTNILMSAKPKEHKRTPMVTVKPSNSNFVNDIISMTEDVSKLAEEMNGDSSDQEDTMETAD